jgi:hypothetical protein
VTSYNDYYNAIGPNRQNISHNWTDDSGDPKFTDISATADPAIDPATLWNFDFQSSSTAIDGGTYLATANGAGNNSTSLVLNTEAKDSYPASLFFYDAGNIASAWPTANVNSDWIAIGSVSDVVQISSINYSTNTITLASPMTWNNGAGIWLYKKSDGATVLYGTAPDYGAHEYQMTSIANQFYHKVNLIKNTAMANYRIYDLQGRLIKNGLPQLSCGTKTTGVFIIANSGNAVVGRRLLSAGLHLRVR